MAKKRRSLKGRGTKQGGAKLGVAEWAEPPAPAPPPGIAASDGAPSTRQDPAPRGSRGLRCRPRPPPTTGPGWAGTPPGQGHGAGAGAEPSPRRGCRGLRVCRRLFFFLDSSRMQYANEMVITAMFVKLS